MQNTTTGVYHVSERYYSGSNFRNLFESRTGLVSKLGLKIKVVTGTRWAKFLFHKVPVLYHTTL